MKNNAIKDYSMRHEYTVENFLGLPLEDQLFLLHGMKKFINNTNDEWLIDNYDNTFGSYYDNLKDIILTIRKYSRLRDDIKKIYKINLVNEFYNSFELDLQILDWKDNLDDNLEYCIAGKHYIFNDYDKRLINPYKIYLQDLNFNNDEEKEQFCINMIHAYRFKSLGQMPMSQRIIELFDPILLDIYGEELFNYIKSFHHSFSLSVIEHISSKRMPMKGKNFISNEVHEYYQSNINSTFLYPTTNENLDEELEMARKNTLATIDSFMLFHNKQK